MAEMTLSVTLVEKLKKLSKGINPELDRIREEFRVTVDFDGKSGVKLKHKSSDYLNIAVNSIDKRHGSQKTDNDDFDECIEDHKVWWNIKHESALKIVNLFEKELDRLKKISKVDVHHDKEKKSLTKVDISCEIDKFDKVNASVKDIKERSSEIKPEYVEVGRKDFPKATRFCLQERVERAFCYFDGNEDCLKIYGLDKKHSDKVLEKWNAIIGPPKEMVPAQSEAASNHTSDKNKSLSSKPEDSTANNGNSGTKPKTDKNKPKVALDQSMNDKDSQVTNDVHGDHNQDKDHGVPNEGKKVPEQVKEDNDDDPKEQTGVDDTSEANNTDKSGDLKSIQGNNQDEQNNLNHSKTGIPRQSMVDPSSNASAAGPKREPGKKSKDGKYEFNCGQLKVLVYKESVTDIKGMDAIVNAANERMMHGGGVAYYISKAAGKKMDAECNEYISKNGNLQVTENFVSKAGDMKCKGIIHAVGPQWYHYRGRQVECAKDVYSTITKCLEATNQRGWKKIALIAISSGIFGVPKQLCAEMYIKAIVDFSHSDPGSLREIHFVDVNPDILDMVEKAHGAWVADPSTVSFDNALQYQDAPSYAGRKTQYKKEPQTGQSENQGNPDVEFIQKQQNRYYFKVLGILDVQVYTGSVLELQNVEAIVCSMDPEFKGVLLRRIIEEAGQKMAKEYQQQEKKSKGWAQDSEVYVFPGGKLRVKKILSVVMDRYITAATPSDLSKLHEYFIRITEKAEREKIGSLALPMIGCGSVKDVRYCCDQLIKTVIGLCQEALKTGQKTYLKELHLVNYEDRFTQYLLDSLKRTATTRPYVHKQQWIESRHSDGWTLHTRLKELTPKTQMKKSADMKTTMKTGKKLTGKTKQNCYYFKDCKKNATKEFECAHVFCDGCTLSMKSGCKVCLSQGTSKPSLKSVAGASSLGDLGDTCPICLESFSVFEKLPCTHELCKSCLGEIKIRNPVCPICQSVFGIVTGNQPDGQMHYRTVHEFLPGYQKHGTIEILFTFQDGKQKENHPSPGRPFKGTQRRAYLPNNEEGQKVLLLFRRAFDRRLLFTVGESRTSGKENCVTYNDIHFKTKTFGGAANYGYPDNDYLSRVQEELKARGITE